MIITEYASHFGYKSLTRLIAVFSTKSGSFSDFSDFSILTLTTESEKKMMFFEVTLA
jgi:hypothetical protein